MMKNLSRIVVLLMLSTLILGCSHSVEKFSVMTYNIRFDNLDDGVNSWTFANRRSKVFSVLEKYHPDILGVQEALHNQVVDIENYFKDEHYSRIGVGRDDGKTKGEYMAIFFNNEKFKLLDKGHFWLSETPDRPSLGWDSSDNIRICTWVYLEYNDNVFYVFNTHFDHVGRVAQYESAKLMIQKIKEINTKNQPVVFIGDLNITPDNKGIIYLKENGLKDGYSVFNSQKKLPVGTFNGFKIDQPLRRKVDYVFISKGFNFKDYIIDDKKIDGLYPSDHLPIYAELEFVLE